MKRWIYYLGILFVYMSCSSNKKAGENDGMRDSLDTKENVEVGIFAGDVTERTFKGVLPCADCPGIKYELELWNDQYADKGTYKMEMDYEDRDADFEQKGTWATIKGEYADPVYVLTPDSVKESKTYFLFKTDSLIMLDNQMKMIDSKLNYTLKLEDKDFEKPKL